MSYVAPLLITKTKISPTHFFRCNPQIIFQLIPAGFDFANIIKQYPIPPLCPPRGAAHAHATNTTNHYNHTVWKAITLKARFAQETFLGLIAKQKESSRNRNFISSKNVTKWRLWKNWCVCVSVCLGWGIHYSKTRWEGPLVQINVYGDIYNNHRILRWSEKMGL